MEPFLVEFSKSRLVTKNNCAVAFRELMDDILEDACCKVNMSSSSLVESTCNKAITDNWAKILGKIEMKESFKYLSADFERLEITPVKTWNVEKKFSNWSLHYTVKSCLYKCLNILPSKTFVCFLEEGNKKEISFIEYSDDMKVFLK